MGMAYNSTSCVKAVMIRGVKPHKRTYGTQEVKTIKDKAHTGTHSGTDEATIKNYLKKNAHSLHW